MKPLDYEALTLGLRKMNFLFAGKKIGLPKIGAGLAGGDWSRIKEIIQTELNDCDVTVINYSGPKNY
jgi:O-acetyl-ADP-ribose deacetylase (regulator of RNase III)